MKPQLTPLAEAVLTAGLKAIADHRGVQLDLSVARAYRAEVEVVAAAVLAEVGQALAAQDPSLVSSAMGHRLVLLADEITAVGASHGASARI